MCDQRTVLRVDLELIELLTTDPPDPTDPKLVSEAKFSALFRLKPVYSGLKSLRIIWYGTKY